MSVCTYIDPDAIILKTRIPETHAVEGLEYGAHVSCIGWSGYYVRPRGSERWGVARLTPASDELYDTDEEIVRAIEEEFNLAKKKNVDHYDPLLDEAERQVAMAN